MEWRPVVRSEEQSEKERVWKMLSEAGFIDIAPDKVQDRIRDAKDVVMGRLSELLTVRNEFHERESAAYSLATLRKLEKTLERGLAPRGSVDIEHR
jgi:hypothetical protein